MGRAGTRGRSGRLRRGLALGLTLCGVSLAGQTAGVKGALGWSAPAFAVAALSEQTGWTDWQGVEKEIGPWGRLFLDQSALLRQGIGSTELNLEEGPPVTAPEPPAEPEPQPVPQTSVVEHTSVGGAGKNMQQLDNIYIQNSTGQPVDVEALAAQEVDLKLGDGPQILIYHTHGSEAYTQTEDSRYVESDSYRTTDCEKNVVRVGEAMAEVFQAQGFEVLHDTTLYDYPAYNGAYDRSRAGVEHWLDQYPTVRFVLDVHRDALVSQDGAAYKLVAQEGEDKVAQVMFVVGSGTAEQSHPNWRENLALAVKLQMALAGRYDQLARPITLRTSRYNQHLSVGALLVEVGGHGNTLEEAIEGGKLFARTVGAELRKNLEH